jgi:hypothetical protein
MDKVEQTWLDEQLSVILTNITRQTAMKTRASRRIPLWLGSVVSVPFIKVSYVHMTWCLNNPTEEWLTLNAGPYAQTWDIYRVMSDTIEFSFINDDVAFSFKMKFG